MNWPSTIDGRAFVSGIVQLLYAYPAAPITVTTEVELLALTSLGPRFEDLCFTFRNLSDTVPLAIWVDRSESGVVKNFDRATLIVPPAAEGQLEFRGVLSNFWGASAAGDPDNNNPSCSLSWMLIGKLRRL